MSDTAEPEVNSVQLHACEPGDEITFSSLPTWLEDAFDKKKIVPIAGDSVDGTDWVYLIVTTNNGEVICRTDDRVRLLDDGSLVVQHYRTPTKMEEEQCRKALSRRSS